MSLTVRLLPEHVWAGGRTFGLNWPGSPSCSSRRLVLALTSLERDGPIRVDRRQKTSSSAVRDLLRRLTPTALREIAYRSLVALGVTCSKQRGKGNPKQVRLPNPWVRTRNSARATAFCLRQHVFHVDNFTRFGRTHGGQSKRCGLGSL